jgi:hypothetical protein
MLILIKLKKEYVWKRNNVFSGNEIKGMFGFTQLKFSH